MAPALTEAGQSQNFALTSSNCSPIGLRNGGSVGGGTVEGIGSPRVRRTEGPGAVSDIPEEYVSCKRSLIGAGVDGNGVDEAAFENLTTLAIASELFKVNKSVTTEGSHVVNGHFTDTIGGESVNGGVVFGQLWNTSGMSTNLPDDTGGDADGSEAAELPMPTDDLGQNVRDLLEVIQGMEKTEEANVQDPFGSDRKSSVSPHDHVRANDGSIFSTSNHDGASEFDLPNGPVDGMYPVPDLDCNLSGVDMMPMCVVELPGGGSGNGMGNGAGTLLDTSSLGVGGNSGGLLDGGGLDSQLALDSHLAEDGLCVSREALSGEKKCEVQKRQAEVERKIERLLRRLGKLQARRMGRHAAEELRVVVEHAKQSLSNMAGSSGKGGVGGNRRNETYDSSLSSSEAGKRPPFLSSYVQDAVSDPAAGLRIGRPYASLGSGGDAEGASESLVKSEDVRNLPTATLESLAQRLDRTGAGKLTKRYFGSGSPRARLEEAVEGAVAAAEVGSSTSRAEDARRRRRRRRFGEWGVEDEENDELGRKKVQTGQDVDAGDEKRRRRRVEERMEVKRDGDVKVVVVRRGNWGCGVGTEEAEVEEAFGKLGAQFRVVEKGIDSDATASSSGAESADETVSGYSASATGTLSIGRRAAWKWARDRAWVGSRWTWLQAQISDLEYRIRQQNEIHRQIRATKGPLVFAKPAEQVLQSQQTVVVNGFHHTEMGKNVEGCAGEGDTCCRVRPLRFLPRKRRLLRASDPGGVGGDGGKRGRGSCVSPPSKAAEVLCTGCHQNAFGVPPCVLCSAPRQGQSAPSLSTPRAPPPSSLPVPERVARIDPLFHPILSFPRDISADIHVGAIMKTQSWQQEVLSEKGKPSLANFTHSSTSAGRSGGTTAGMARRRRGGAVGGARRGRRPTLSGGSMHEEQEEESIAAGSEFNPGTRGGASLGSRRRNYAGFRIKKVTSNALTSKLRHKLTKGRRGRGRVGGNHCDPLNRHNQKRLKAAMALQSVCDEADEQLRMELGLPPLGTFSAPGTAPSSPFPPASPASPGSTSPPHHSSASSSSSTSSTSHHHPHHHSSYSPSSSSIALGSYSIGPGGDRKASMLHDLLSRRKRENSYDIDNIVIPYSVAASTRVEKLPYKEILTPKWRVVEPFPPKKLEAGDNGVVRRSSHESEEEDVSADAVAERHERCEQEERKRFLRLLRRPHGANSSTGDAKSQGGGRGGHRRGRADSRAESSGQNTPDPLSPDHHSACPSPLPLSAAISPPPTPLPLPPLPEEADPTSPDAPDSSTAPSPSKNPAESATQASSSSSSSKLQESQSQAEPTVSLAAKSQTSEAVVPSPTKVVDGRLSAAESPAVSPFKTQASKLNNTGSKGSKGWNEAPVSARRRTVSSSLLHPLSGGGRERSTTPIDPYDEYPQPKPFEPYVFPLSDDQYKVLLAKMPLGHHFPPICPSQTSPPPSQPSSQASSTSGDGPTEATQPSPSVISSKNGNSMEQVPSAPRSPCSETTESVLEEDDRGEDDLGQGDVGDNDDPDWTLRDEVRGRASKR